jgi:hypothetical protein
MGIKENEKWNQKDKYSTSCLVAVTAADKLGIYIFQHLHFKPCTARVNRGVNKPSKYKHNYTIVRIVYN